MLLEKARQLDNADKLSSFKDRFYIPKNTLYFDGNSLGLCTKDSEQLVLKALNDWKTLGIDLWTDSSTQYFTYQDKLGKLLAPLINADPNEVTVCANTTLNIHSAIATFYKPTAERYKILVDDLNFPTDRYAISSQISLKGLDPETALKTVKSRDGDFIYEDDIIEAMTDDVCIVLLPAVLYRTSQIVDMKKIADEAKKRGIFVGFDLCHSIGAVPHDFKDIDPDFAVWCNYKYLNGGPGAIAGLYINQKHFQKQPGLLGWHGNDKATQFELLLDYKSSEYAGAWQTGTQPILSMVSIEGSLNIYAQAGIQNIRKKSLALTSFLMELINEKLTKYGFSIANPLDEKSRGGHVALRHSDAIRINAALKSKGVVPDFRYPDIIRLCPAALYISFEDVYNVVEIISSIMETKEYEKFKNETGPVA